MAENIENRFRFINESYVPVGDAEHFVKRIADIGLAADTSEAVIGAGLETVGDLCKCQMRHLYRIKGMGKKHVFEVLKKLQTMGLDFMRVPKVEGEAGAAVATDASQKPKPKQGARPEHSGNRDRQQGDRQQGDRQKANSRDNNRDRPQGDRQKANSRDNNRDRPQGERQKASSREGNRDNNRDRQNAGGRDRRDSRDRDSRNSRGGQRVKINSYDVDSSSLKGNNNNRNDRSGISPTANITRTRRLKEERSRKLAKAIGAIQPLKNEDGLYKFYRSGKWGYKDEGGKVVIEPSYTEAFNFSEGRACVEIDEKCGFIDKAGELVIAMQYDTACSFHEGVASVSLNDKCGYIDMDGKEVFGLDYEAATSFKEDISLVKLNGKWGYMTRQTGQIRLR